MAADDARADERAPQGCCQRYLGRRRADGPVLETEGYLWVSGTGVFLNVAATSDQPPLFVDVVGVPLDMLAKVKAACLAERPSSTAGCQAVVRGRGGNRGNRNVRGIFATYIAPQS